MSGAMARAKGFMRGYSQPEIQSVELRPSWLPSLHIMRISHITRTADVEALTERVSCCAASEGLIEGGKGRTKMREMSFSPRCLYARWTSAVCFSSGGGGSGGGDSGRVSRSGGCQSNGEGGRGRQEKREEAGGCNGGDGHGCGRFGDSLAGSRKTLAEGGQEGVRDEGWGRAGWWWWWW